MLQFLGETLWFAAGFTIEFCPETRELMCKVGNVTMLLPGDIIALHFWAFVGRVFPSLPAGQEWESTCKSGETPAQTSELATLPITLSMVAQGMYSGGSTGSK